MEPDITERIIIIDWSVKGYHAFRLKPHSDIYLNVIEEPNNPYSTDAMSVVMPSLVNIPAYLHNSESDFAGMSCSKLYINTKMGYTTNETMLYQRQNYNNQLPPYGSNNDKTHTA